MAELFVLFKGKGLPTVADNYRAIALSDDFRRVYERLVQARLAKWSYLKNATGSMQFGFKRGTGTLEAIFSLRSFLLYATKILQVPAFVVFIDLRKAFPSMSRPKIVETFREQGVPAKITRAVASLLSGSVQRLKVNGWLTEPFTVTTGTPEGSINSPEIFAMVYKVILEELDIHELPSDLNLVERGKVYYIVFADDLSFFSLEIQAIPPKVVSFKASCQRVDMAMNAAKSKWMAFLPETPATTPSYRDWVISVDGEELENVDEFTYLGFQLDCHLTDRLHAKRINERYLRAARVTGKLMRDLKCVNLFTLKKIFLSMVFSQLYGLIFVDSTAIDFERGVGIFLKTSLGLPESYPHSVAMALLGVKHLALFQLEQRLKFLTRWELNKEATVFDVLVNDRVVLFPQGVGLNSSLGRTLVDLGFSRTLDYRSHTPTILTTMARKIDLGRKEELMSTEGRAFWTEIGLDGLLPNGLKQVLTKLSFENARIVFLLFADALCWSAVKRPTRSCPSCDAKFTTAHFFCCTRFFIQEEGWRIFIGLCRAESWTDAIDFIFAILRKWVECTNFFRPNFRLHVTEYENLCSDVDHMAFRWNIF
jgi:hypothetical protein